MLRRLSLVCALTALALVPASCRTAYTEKRRGEVERGALMQRELVSYHVVQSAHLGKVGYLKVYDVVEAGGRPYRWKYVYDLDFNELGFVDQFGGAFRFTPYTDHEEKIHRTPMRVDQLPADSYENNVLRMLGIDPATTTITFPVATAADIAYAD